MKKAIILLVIVLLLAGCAVGPDFKRPAVDTPQGFRFEDKEAKDLANTAWWQQFNDPVLNDLVIFTFIVFVAGQLWAAPITIKFATGMPADEEEALHRGAEVFKKFVEQKAPGRLKVDIYPSNQLGKEREQFEGTKLGTIEMCWIAEGPMAAFFTEIMVLGIPYLYTNEAVAFRSLDGSFGKALMEEMRKKTGVRSLGIGENGFRHFSTRNKPIKNVDDMKGLKIRVMEHPGYMALVKSLGGSPTPIAWGEVYMALQQGVVDGWEAPISLIESMKFNDGHQIHHPRWAYL